MQQSTLRQRRSAASTSQVPATPPEAPNPTWEATSKPDNNKLNQPREQEPSLFSQLPSIFAIPDEILPGSLYLGSLQALSDPNYLHDTLHIRHIIALGPFDRLRVPLQQKLRDNSAIEFHCFDIHDSTEEAIEDIFEATGAILEDAVAREEASLVHCAAGISRSATVVLAYLLMKKGMRLAEAYDLVKERRPRIGPNIGFMGKLVELERSLFDGETTLDLETYTENGRAKKAD